MLYRNTTPTRKSRVFGRRPASERIVPDPPRVTRYQPTIFVDNDTLERIQQGWLKLQPGQWIQLAWCDKPARWAGITPGGTVVAQHWEPHACFCDGKWRHRGYCPDKFRTLRAFAKGR